MPRIQAASPQDRLAPYGDLVQELANELTKGSSKGEPLIIERPVGTKGAVHVFVVWRKWPRVPNADRGAVILAAYKQAIPKMVSRIAVTMGVTFEVAMEMNLLPFAVQPRKDMHALLGKHDFHQHMLAEGAFFSQHNEIELRFPTEEMAESARKRIAKRTNTLSSDWAVVRSVLNYVPSGE